MRRASLHMLLCQFAMALGLLLSLGSEAWAARPAPQAAVDLEAPPALAEDASLDQLNAQLDLIRQRVTADASDDLLAELRQSALQVQRQADALLALITPTERAEDAAGADQGSDRRRPRPAAAEALGAGTAGVMALRCREHDADGTEPGLPARDGDVTTPRTPGERCARSP